MLIYAAGHRLVTMMLAQTTDRSLTSCPNRHRPSRPRITTQREAQSHRPPRASRTIPSGAIIPTIGRAEIPIASAAPPHVPPSAVSFLGGFRTPAAGDRGCVRARPASETLYRTRPTHRSKASQLVPAGAVAGRALHPLESAAFLRRMPAPDSRTAAKQVPRRTHCAVRPRA